MFVDASAIIGIIADEDDRLLLSTRLAAAHKIHVSPIVIYEAAAGLAGRRACSIEEAEALVELFMTEVSGTNIPLGTEIGLEAVKAFRCFGKGRHKADLMYGCPCLCKWILSGNMRPARDASVRRICTT
jgi:ribonuclease VapC